MGQDPVIYWDKAKVGRPGKVVVLDPGHDPIEPGAMGTTGVAEVVFNDRLATRIGVQLRAHQGITAIVSRRSHEPLGLEDRARRISQLDPDLVVSIHHDSVKPQFLTWKDEGGRRLPVCEQFSGFSIFAQAKGPHHQAGQFFARAVAENYRRLGLSHTSYHALKIPGENRRWIDSAAGIHAGDYLFLLRTIDRPVVLIESGFIVNPNDERRLRDPTHVEALAKSVADAIVAFAARTPNHRR